MKFILAAILAFPLAAFGDLVAVPDSKSPDGKFHAIMDIDRDPTLNPEWKGDSYPHIEITEITTGKVCCSVKYFGAVGDDERPLREHVNIAWRPNSTAFALTIDDKFYSSTCVFAMNGESKFANVQFPSYEDMTGFTKPDSNDLRPRGRSTVKGWNTKGHLMYGIFLSPLPTYKGKDPLEHEVVLEVSPTGMKRISKSIPKNADQNAEDEGK